MTITTDKKSIGIIFEKEYLKFIIFTLKKDTKFIWMIIFHHVYEM